MKIHMNLGEHSYDIILERGCLAKLNEYVDLSHKAMIISDDHVPQHYIDTIAAQCREHAVHIVAHGEQAKSMNCVQEICAD